MTQPKVSIIVPTFNRAHYLPECLDSLLAQTVSPQEIIVVDDGSEDATREVVARYGPPVRYIYKENGGKSTAVNMALSECKGDLVWLFDDDDVALPDAIEHRLEALSENPEAGFVYSAHYLGSDGQDGKIVKGKLYVPPQPAPEAFFLEIMKGCFFHLNSCLVRRELYLTVGDFDRQLKTGEDHDMQIRLARIAPPFFSSKPSFVFRQHMGVRGDKSIRYDAARRNKMFRTYSAVLGRKLRNNVSLGEFLIPSNDEVLNTKLMQNALLNRIHVMASHGCVPELISDIRTLLENSTRSIPLDIDDFHKLTSAMSSGFACDACIEGWKDFIDEIRALKGLSQRGGAVRAIAFAFYIHAKSYPGDLGTRADKAIRAFRLVIESYRTS